MDAFPFVLHHLCMKFTPLRMMLGLALLGLLVYAWQTALYLANLPSNVSVIEGVVLAISVVVVVPTAFYYLFLNPKHTTPKES